MPRSPLKGVAQTGAGPVGGTAMFYTLLQVALGGALGSSARFLVNIGAGRMLGFGFPWGTLIVNIAGSFIMGMLMVFLLERGARSVPFFMSGILGGFTTFSAFSLDAVTLYQRGQAGLAGAYVVGSVVLALAALASGMALARSFA